MLGLIGLLGSSIRVTNDARYRAEAANLANAMIADMWTTTRRTSTRFTSAKLPTWTTKVAALLPGGIAPDVDDHAGVFVGEQHRRRHRLLADARRPRAAPARDDRPDREESPMREHSNRDARGLQRGVGLIEVMVSIVIAMLLVLVIYQIYEISEGQKRTITAGSDAQQNAAYGLYVLGRDLAIAGNGIASTAATLDQCALLRPIPVLIEAGRDGQRSGHDHRALRRVGLAGDARSHSCRTRPSTTYVGPGTGRRDSVRRRRCGRRGPGRHLHDVDDRRRRRRRRRGNRIRDAHGTRRSPAISLQRIRAVDRVAGEPRPGRVDGTHRLYGRCQPRMRCARRSSFPNNDPVAPLVSDVVNLKAQYGLDTNNDGIIDSWQDAATAPWTAASLPALSRSPRFGRYARSAWRSSRAARNTRRIPSPTGPLVMFDNSLGGHTESMSLTTDDTHYRYKVLETVIPLRNALWNPS
mgnify:CR=1 FL=1